MTRSRRRSPSDATSSASGASDSSINAWPAWTNAPARVAPGLFPPEVVVQIKALACELPATLGVPLSRLSTADVVREVQRHGIVARSAARPSGAGCTTTPPPLAAPPLDLSARSRLCRKGGAHLDLYHGSGTAAAGGRRFRRSALTRRRAFKRASTQPPDHAAGPASRCASNTNTSAAALGVPGGARRPSREALRPLRRDHRHRPV